MWGFGKKKLNERMLGMISVELSMFLRWVEDNRHRMLTPPEVEDIAKRILDRENYKHGQQELFGLVALAMASDVKRIDEFRKRTGFDAKITGFCTSIGIPLPS